MNYLTRIWNAISKSRYTHRLEQENKELREQLLLWQNALLESVHLPRLTPREQAGPLPELKRRLTPSQWVRAAQRVTDNEPKKEGADGQEKASA